MPTPAEIKAKILAKKGTQEPAKPKADKTPASRGSDSPKPKFIVHTTYGEIMDLAERLQDEGCDTKMYIPDHNYCKIGEGMVEKEKEWYRCIGQGYIWVFDGCEHGDLQDWLREKGEFVFGGNQIGDDLENERQLNQKWFKDAGFYQPFSKNFKSIDEAIAFVEDNLDKRWILKQNGDAPKSINHMGKFEGNADMLFHLKEIKKGWNEQQNGAFDCDLMEVVEGMEVAVSGFFNGHDYLRNKEGKVVAYLNFEHKKETDGDLGQTTGETATLFYGTTDDNGIVKEILMKPLIIDKLKEINFRGVFDINCILTDKGIVALEPTCRFGVPSTAYEFLEALITPCNELIEAIAKGEDLAVEIKEGWGQVIVISAAPYPLEGDFDDELTSLGEKLWIMDGDGKTIIPDFTKEQKKHIHLYNFEKTIDKDTDEECYKVVTKSGYLLTITSTEGDTIQEVRDNLLKYVKDNIYLSGFKFRQDVGKRIEPYEEWVVAQ